jgi:hypothetical protein
MDKRVDCIYLYYLQVEFYGNRYKGSEGRTS